MSIEAIKTAGMDFQAATSNSVKPNTETAANTQEAANVSEATASRTLDISTKDSSRSGDYEGSESSDSTAAEAVKRAVEEINRQNPNKTVQFGIHDKTGRMTIKILDKSTKSVVKEFPAEKTLDLIAKAWEMAGIMVDEKR